MKILRAALVSSVLLALLSTPATARVVLVGVDGASWNRLDPMLRAGELPHLEALIARGVHAELATVEPVNSPTVWTSIATGRPPSVHGVTDFFPTRLQIRAPSSFERLAAAGLRVGLYDYLLTWPPAPLPGGFVIPGWLRRDASVSPPDLWSRVPLTPFVNSYDDARTSEDYRRRARQELESKAPRWNTLSKAFDLDVGAVTFYAIDMTSHRFWEAGFPEEFEAPRGGYSPEEKSAVADAIRGIDRSVGEIVSALGPEDVLLLASDHGFYAHPEGGRSVWVVHFEDSLSRAGHEKRNPAFSLLGTFGAVTLRVAPGDVVERDATGDMLLEMLRTYRTLEGESLFSFIDRLDLAERPAGHERSWLEQIRQWGVKKVAGWLFNVSFDSNAHAVVIGLPDDEVLEALWPDGEVMVAGKRMPIRDVLARQRFTGQHDPTAVFVAAGGPVRARSERGQLSVLDLSPLLFYLAGQPIPDDLDGTLPGWLLDPEALASAPARTVPAGSLPVLRESDSETNLEDPELREKLRALGYIE